jgi:hypothetical protein
MVGITGVRQHGPCTRMRLPPPDRRRTDLFHGTPRKTHWGGTLGQLFFAVEPHSLGGRDGQHRGRWTGTWPWGLHLAEPPPRVAGHPCDRDEATTETTKVEAGEGDTRWKVGQSVY